MKLPAILDALRKSTSVADPMTWKNRSAAIAAVSLLITALAQVALEYGYDLSFINEEMARDFAAAVFALVSVWSHYATSNKVGLLPPKRDVDGNVLPEAGGASGGATKPDPSNPDMPA